MKYTEVSFLEVPFPGRNSRNKKNDECENTLTAVIDDIKDNPGIIVEIKDDNNIYNNLNDCRRSFQSAIENLGVEALASVFMRQGRVFLSSPETFERIKEREYERAYNKEYLR